MKTLKFLLLSATMTLLCWSGFSQNSDKYQMYAVHEDVVKPSMVGEYEAIMKEFKTVMDTYKNDIEGLQYLCATSDDFRYLFIWPIANMADLDKNPIMEVRAKMGAEKFDNLMARMDACYDKHGTYTLVLDKEMSYMPDGISQTQAGMPYRVYYYYYASPGNMAKLAKMGMKMKELVSRKNSGMHYRVYRSAFGSMDSFFLVAVSAKDPAHLAQLQMESEKLLGEERLKIINEILKYTSKFDTQNGWMREDISVTQN